MYSEVTSVYVPVKTPDYKGWAVVLSIVVHGALLAGLLFFYHSPTPPPMETSLITPEQLSEIQGQIRANQQQNANNAGDMSSASSMADIFSDVTKLSNSQHSQSNPKTAEMMKDIAIKEAQWRAQQEEFAKQIDKEVIEEQQQVIEHLDSQQAEEQKALAHNRQAEENIDQIKEQLKAAAAAYDKKLNNDKSESPTPTATTKSMSLGTDGKSTAQGQTSSNGGNGAPRKGGASGGDSANYISTIMAIIESHWSVPSNSMGKSLVASFSVASDGTISGISINSAGDEAFKASLRQAISSSSPLPPPPNGGRTFIGRFKAD